MKRFLFGVFFILTMIFFLYPVLADDFPASGLNVETEKPKIIVNSPELNQPKEKKSATKILQSSALDLKEFFEMEDPYEAAKAIKKHLDQMGLSADELSEKAISKDLNRISGTENDRTIHLLSGTKLEPEPGIEDRLLQLADTKSKQSATAETSSTERTTAIIQFYDEMTVNDAIAVLEAGTKIYEHISKGSFIVTMPFASVKRLEPLANVRWIGEYLPEYKHSAQPSHSSRPGAFIYPIGGDDKPEYRQDLKDLNIEIRGYDRSAKFYDVTLDVYRFAELSQLWWVKCVIKEPEEGLEASTGQNVTVNFEPDDSRQLIMAYDSGHTGNGVLVGIRDNGVHDTHPQLSGIFHADSELDTNSDHGSHVTGIVAGRSFAIEGPWGNTNVQGVAPQANILFRKNASTGWDWVPWIDSYSSDFTSFSDNDVQISNHSYHIPDSNDDPFFGYDAHTQNFDAYCDNDDMVIVKSAGNQGGGSDVTNPGTGKNVIAVGSINYITTGGETIGQRARYSSTGPTPDDGRLKPELVAPGGGADNFGQDDTTLEGVVSTNSGAADNTQIDGNYSDYEWESDDAYIRYSGTSMAAPHVTGVLAQMKQWKTDFHSELMKALLINTTIPLKANSNDALAGYANTDVGYGMVNAFSVISEYAGESERLLFGNGKVTEDVLEQEWDITVPAGAEQLIVTLAYNDQEGEEDDDNALKDDLDLVLTAPDGTEYRASDHLAVADGVTTQSPIEKMVIDSTNIASGDWTAKIEFVDSPGFWWPIFAEQEYGIVAHAIFKTPEITVAFNQPSITVASDQEFIIQPTITNTGGYIAAGITTKVTGDPSFTGLDQTRYVGNLLHENATFTPEIHLTAPTQEGPYYLTVEVDGINREFSAGYPKKAQIKVEVGSSINKALAWLKTQQNGSGYWDSSRGSVGVTAMATLAFLNANYTEADDVVSGGIDHLLANVRGDGGIYGSYGVYETSLAILALKATYNPEYKDEIADAASFLLNAQNQSNPANSWYGGWTYSSRGGSADLSNSQFVGMALSAAEIDLSEPVWDRFDTFLRRTQSLDRVNDMAWADGRTDGGFCYTANGTQPYAGMTAAGIWSLRLSGKDVNNDRVQAALAWLESNEDLSFDDVPNDPGFGHRLAYYRLAFAKTMALSFLDPADPGKWYTDWYDKLKERMASEQDDDGFWNDHHGAVIDTCFSILALQTIQPPADDLWLSIILASPADLFVYDPQERVCSQSECTIPGAFFEIDASGRQIVTLPELESGHYRMMIQGTGDGLCHLTVNGYRGGDPGDPASAAEISSTSQELMITENQVKTSDLLLSSIVGALTFDVEEPKETSVINSGWQMISLQLQPNDTSIGAVLGSIAGEYESVWTSENGTWLVYDPDNPGLSDLLEMTAGKGYWINMVSRSLSPDFTGTAPSKSIDLVDGWNLVGFNSETALSIGDALASIEGKYISVWGYENGEWKLYDPANPGFSDLDMMVPGFGYWINTSGSCTWTLP